MKDYKIELKWSLVFAAMMLLWMLMERLVGLHDVHIDQHAIYTNFVAIPAVLIFVLALRDKKRSFHGEKMSYKQALKTGFVMSLVLTVLSPILQVITVEFITPEYFGNVIEYAVEMEKMTREEAEAYFNTKSYVIQSLIGTPVMGIATTLIVGLFVRTKKK